MKRLRFIIPFTVLLIVLLVVFILPGNNNSSDFEDAAEMAPISNGVPLTAEEMNNAQQKYLEQKIDKMLAEHEFESEEEYLRARKILEEYVYNKSEVASDTTPKPTEAADEATNSFKTDNALRLMDAYAKEHSGADTQNDRMECIDYLVNADIIAAVYIETNNDASKLSVIKTDDGLVTVPDSAGSDLYLVTYSINRDECSDCIYLPSSAVFTQKSSEVSALIPADNGILWVNVLPNQFGWLTRNIAHIFRITEEGITRFQFSNDEEDYLWWRTHSASLISPTELIIYEADAEPAYIEEIINESTEEKLNWNMTGFIPEGYSPIAWNEAERLDPGAIAGLTDGVYWNTINAGNITDQDAMAYAAEYFEQSSIFRNNRYGTIIGIEKNASAQVIALKILGLTDDPQSLLLIKCDKSFENREYTYYPGTSTAFFKDEKGLKANVTASWQGTPEQVVFDDYVLPKGLKESWYDTRFYPIYPGGPEWQKHSMKDTIYINNPPYDLLFSMSSKELAKLLLECPDLSQITVYYGEDGSYAYDQFFGFLEANSDIFLELLRREDGIGEILNAYRNTGVDVLWFDNEAYDQTEADLYKWYSEVFGSQFLHLYSDVFTEAEAELAVTVLSEKNKVYNSTENAAPDYFDRSDIEHSNHIGEQHKQVSITAEPKLTLYHRIYENQEEFFCVDTQEYLDKTVAEKMLPDSLHGVVWQEYVLIDLNNDGTDELIFLISDDTLYHAFYFLFVEKNDKILAYLINYRGICPLYANGIIAGASGAAYCDFYRFTDFTESGYDIMTLVSSKGDYYEIDGQKTTLDEFLNFCNEMNSVEKAKWIALNK